MGARRAVLVGAVLAAAWFPAAAGAQSSWLMQYVSGWDPEPAMINAEQPTTVTLWGWMPYDCGRVTGAVVLDSAHVGFTLREAGPCGGDTTRTWRQPFALGLLPAGYHTLHVRREFFAAGADTPAVAEASFTFYVEASATPPPPEPPGLPEHPSVQVRCLSGWFTEPAAPNDQTPTRLVAWGWFPYLCGQVTSAAVVAPLHVALTLEPGAPCADTVRTWQQGFDLGVLTSGAHEVVLDLTVTGDPRDSTTTRTARIPVFVGLAPETDVAPNPFVSEARLTLVQPEPAAVDAAIFDLGGRRLATLAQGALPAGTHIWYWGGREPDGTRVPVGVYFYRVRVADQTITRRLVLLPR